MKIIVNPDYDHLKDFIRSIPSLEYPWDFVRRARRNSLQKVTVDGVSMIIKRYKRPTIANCLVYTFLRKNKAQRAYEYAQKLLGLGIETAAPIAYIVEKKHGFYHTGYFVSTHLDYSLLEDIEAYGEVTKRAIIKDFARFTADMHRKGVVHKDFNLSNILFYYYEGSYRFAMIDINRMKFGGSFSASKCLKSMRLLGFKLPSLALMAEEYAKLMGWNPELFCGGLMIKRGFHPPTHIKRFFKGILAALKRPFEAEEVPAEKITQPAAR